MSGSSPGRWASSSPARYASAVSRRTSRSRTAPSLSATTPRRRRIFLVLPALKESSKTRHAARIRRAATRMEWSSSGSLSGARAGLTILRVGGSGRRGSCGRPPACRRRPGCRWSSRQAWPEAPHPAWPRLSSRASAAVSKPTARRLAGRPGLVLRLVRRRTSAPPCRTPSGRLRFAALAPASVGRVSRVGQVRRCRQDRPRRPPKTGRPCPSRTGGRGCRPEHSPSAASPHRAWRRSTPGWP